MAPYSAGWPSCQGMSCYALGYLVTMPSSRYKPPPYWINFSIALPVFQCKTLRRDQISFVEHLRVPCHSHLIQLTHCLGTAAALLSPLLSETMYIVKGNVHSREEKNNIKCWILDKVWHLIYFSGAWNLERHFGLPTTILWLIHCWHRVKLDWLGKHGRLLWILRK